MRECNVQNKKDNEILDFFKKATENPENLKQHINSLGICDRARLMAFIQVRDSKLYKKITEIMED